MTAKRLAVILVVLVIVAVVSLGLAADSAEAGIVWCRGCNWPPTG